MEHWGKPVGDGHEPFCTGVADAAAIAIPATRFAEQVELLIRARSPDDVGRIDWDVL